MNTPNESLKRGELVIGKDLHPANLIFRVIKETRNGWLHCVGYCKQDGTPCAEASHFGPTLIPPHVFKFRNSEVLLWPPEREGKVLWPSRFCGPSAMQGGIQ